MPSLVRHNNKHTGIIREFIRSQGQQTYTLSAIPLAAKSAYYGGSLRLKVSLNGSERGGVGVGRRSRFDLPLSLLLQGFHPYLPQNRSAQWLKPLSEGDFRQKSFSGFWRFPLSNAIIFSIRATAPRKLNTPSFSGCRSFKYQ